MPQPLPGDRDALKYILEYTMHLFLLQQCNNPRCAYIYGLNTETHAQRLMLIVFLLISGNDILSPQQ